MLNYFIFNGKNSLDYNVLIRNKTSYNAPERDIDIIPVAGRDGDIIIDNKKYNNISMKYGLAMVAQHLYQPNKNLDMAYAIKDFNSWIYQVQGGYFKLTDSYDPLYYRMACITDGISWNTKTENYAESEIEFTCKPYKYLIDGEKTITISEQQTTINNPENFTALPLIRWYGKTATCIIIINGSIYKFDFTNVQHDYVTIDSEAQSVTAGSTNYYSNYTPSSSQLFPTLKAGNNTIFKQGGTTKIELVPRWRCI